MRMQCNVLHCMRTKKFHHGAMKIFRAMQQKAPKKIARNVQQNRSESILLHVACKIFLLKNEFLINFVV